MSDTFLLASATGARSGWSGRDEVLDSLVLMDVWKKSVPDIIKTCICPPVVAHPQMYSAVVDPSTLGFYLLIMKIHTMENPAITLLYII